MISLDLEGDNVEVFYYLITFEICPDNKGGLYRGTCPDNKSGLYRETCPDNKGGLHRRTWPL